MRAHRARLSALTLVACLLAGQPALAQGPEVADGHWAEGQRQREAGRHLEAAEAYARAAEAELASPTPRWSDYSAEVAHAARYYLEAGRAEAALRLLEACLPHLKAAGQPELLASREAQLADTHWVVGDRLREQGRFVPAAEAYIRAAEVDLGRQAIRWKDYAGAMDLAAQSYGHAKRHEDAIRLYDTLLARLEAAGQTELAGRVAQVLADRLWDEGQRHREAGRFAVAAEAYARAAEVERAGHAPRWKDYAAEVGQAADASFSADDAARCFTLLETGIATLKAAGHPALTGTLWGQVGDRRRGVGQFDQALAAYGEAAAVEKAQGPAALGVRHNHMGQTNKAAGRYPEALARFEEALALAREAQDEVLEATVLSNIGGTYWEWERLTEAVPYYEQALAIDRRRRDEAAEASALNNLGTTYMGLARYEEALAHLEQAAALARRADQPRTLALAIGNIGTLHNARGHHREAIAMYEEGLAIEQRLGLRDLMAVSYSNLGEAHSSLDHDADAMRYFEQAMALERVLNRPAQLASVLGNMGAVYQSQGRFDLAIAAFEEALAIDRRLGRKTAMAVRLSNIGYQYRQWGRLDQALGYFDEALALDRAAGREDKAAVDLSNKGRALTELGRFDEAMVCHTEALAIYRRLKVDAGIATAMGDMAGIHHMRQALDQAEALYTEVLAADRRLGREGEVATNLSNLAGIASDRGDWVSARRLCAEAVTIERRLGKPAQLATVLNQMGVIEWRLDATASAIAHLEEAVGLLDRLRLTAKGELRRDYTARSMNAYQQLVEAHTREGRAEAAVMASERAKAKLLAELLTGRDEVPVLPAAAVQASLGADEAAIAFANAARPTLVQLAVTREGVTAVTTETEALSASTATPAAAPTEDRRGVAVIDEPADAGAGLEAVVTAYRAALVQRDAARTRALARVLYDTLIKPLEPQLVGKTRLVVVPDGVVGFVPIEGLVDAQGRYVAERFTITYAHSLAVRQLLAGRQHPEGRQPLLAFGGARYQPVTPVQAATAVEARREAQLALARGGSATDAYGKLGVGNWAELPGTLAEVKAIAQVVPQARVVSGEAVTEAGIKALNAKQELSRYRVLHFATHGLAVPQVPELSALVLSQLTQQPGGEDGYLRAGEVAGLKLAADFVNLSACETGLGKVYGGEGVVGLAQSFLVAGANGLSMSLWSVADASTATFMTELYRTVARDRVGYAEAAHRVKQRFIRGEFGEAYKHPYYWAPFVHYGQ